MRIAIPWVRVFESALFQPNNLADRGALHHTILKHGVGTKLLHRQFDARAQRVDPEGVWIRHCVLRAHHPVVGGEYAVYFLTAGPKTLPGCFSNIDLRSRIIGKDLRPDDLLEGLMNFTGKPSHVDMH